MILELQFYHVNKIVIHNFSNILVFDHNVTGVIILCVVDEMVVEVSLFHESSLVLKNSWSCPWLRWHLYLHQFS